MHDTLRKAVASVLAAVLLLTITGTGFGQSTSLPDMLARAESAVYGNEQSGALLERVVRLEQDVYGEENSGPLLARVQGVYDYLTEGGGATSIVLQLNVVEYLVFERMSSGVGLARRLDDLERNILGTTLQRPVAERADMLVATVWPSRELNVKPVRVPTG